MHSQSQDRDVVEPVSQFADDLACPESAEVLVLLQEIPIAQSAHAGVIITQASRAMMPNVAPAVANEEETHGIH